MMGNGISGMNPSGDDLDPDDGSFNPAALLLELDEFQSDLLALMTVMPLLEITDEGSQLLKTIATNKKTSTNLRKLVALSEEGASKEKEPLEGERQVELSTMFNATLWLNIQTETLKACCPSQHMINREVTTSHFDVTEEIPLKDKKDESQLVKAAELKAEVSTLVAQGFFSFNALKSGYEAFDVEARQAKNNMLENLPTPSI